MCKPIVTSKPHYGCVIDWPIQTRYLISKYWYNRMTFLRMDSKLGQPQEDNFSAFLLSILNYCRAVSNSNTKYVWFYQFVYNPPETEDPILLKYICKIHQLTICIHAETHSLSHAVTGIIYKINFSYVMDNIMLYFLHSTSVLSFYIDVILTLSIKTFSLKIVVICLPKAFFIIIMFVHTILDVRSLAPEVDT